MQQPGKAARRPSGGCDDETVDALGTQDTEVLLLPPDLFVGVAQQDGLGRVVI